MELGMIGLGRMGANMAERLLRGGHRVVGYDPQPEAMQRLTGKGGVGATSVAGLTERLTPPRTVWLMVPSGNPVDDTIEALLPSLSRGDTITDGGNSYYKDSIRRADHLTERGLYFVDVGTSGGIWGLAEGYSLMIGGNRKIVERLTPSFRRSRPRPTRAGDMSAPAAPVIL